MTATAFESIVEKALAKPRNLGVEELERLLSPADAAERECARAAAYSLKCRYCGRKVSMRGLIEIGNVCAKDCFYCGIRRSNSSVRRYSLDVAGIVRMAEKCAALGYASAVLQGGEMESEANTAFIEECLLRMRPLGLGVTLSLGEQTEEVYARWKKAGARRYLLRIETSDRELYSRLHPASHSWERRVECLRSLRRCGYQVGTGVMCALPGQTARQLAGDVKFFGDEDVDMIGMGPYIPHPDTPLAAKDEGFDAATRLEKGLDLIAATRLYLHDVNIAAATALQALAPDGRERGVLAGANVIMPNATDVEYRKAYTLYSGKPCMEENATACRGCLERRLESIGEAPLYGESGDSPHFAARQIRAQEG